MRLRISKTQTIKTVEQWEQFAPPKNKKTHWKDGRSAKSLAQFITDETHVRKLENILKDLGYDTKGIISCIPEANTTLPGRGNGRNHDLLMFGKDFIVGIEAKVSEDFGKLISHELQNPSDNKQNRIDKLAEELFGCKAADIKELRYQLLTGVVGTLLEARKNKKIKALFLIIVFIDGITTKDTSDVAKNNKDYEDFCKCLGLESDGGTIKKCNVDLTIKKIEISLKQ